MSIFWTLPDYALSFTARVIAIAVINATGNISSALNPLIVGPLKDLTQSFTTGLIYASIMLAIGCAIMLMVPVGRSEKRSAINAQAS
jgi:ACS family 4-hydroxyphenylacetate permease-like MFS transporter